LLTNFRQICIVASGDKYSKLKLSTSRDVCRHTTLETAAWNHAISITVLAFATSQGCMRQANWNGSHYYISDST